jgi:hypothetical protein
MRSYHKAAAAGYVAEEVKRLRMLAESLFQALSCMPCAALQKSRLWL